MIDVSIFETFLQIQFEDIHLGPQRLHLGKRGLIQNGEQRAGQGGIADYADVLFLKAREQPGGNGVAYIQMHAEAARQIHTL